MKLYINKNCSGYHWYECILPDLKLPVGEKSYIRMERTGEIPEKEALLRGLKLSGQYDYCLAIDNDKHILALNNLPEKRTDSFGRPISVALIFVTEEDSESVLLFKMLLDRMENFSRFSSQINECFASSIMSKPPCVLCDWDKLQGFLKNILKREFTPEVRLILPKLKGRLLAASPNSKNTLKELGYKDSEISEAASVISAMDSTRLLLPANAGVNDSSTDIDKEENHPSDIKEVASVDICKKTEQESSENGNQADVQSAEIESLKNKYLEESKYLRAQLKEQNEKNQQLSEANLNLTSDLSTAKSEHERYVAEISKKLRLHRHLIAVLIVVIIVLLVIYILK